MSSSPSFTPTSGRPGWRRRAAVLHERVDLLVGRADGLLAGRGADGGPARATSDPLLRGDAVGQVDLLTDRVVDRLDGDALTPDAVDALAVLVCDLQALRLELHDHELVSRTLRLADCERGLARLRTCTTTASLLGSVCEEASRACGFERVLLSRVEDRRWFPWLVNGAIADEPWVVPWSLRSVPVDEASIEAGLLADHRPGLILDTDVPGLPEIFRDGGTGSYVASPVGPEGAAVGFLHADHGIGGERCTETDRDVLWRFSEGFGRL